ncbi:heavy metal translocating P-type ATPase [Halococcus salsus]|uniref:heavy metal translocating P-type ATPase n=1 Tax=Halococcus salsus TaxID=2162894 RepID=UPI001865882B|nr:cation-translocating P-type ATPase [Halococcus salsus]
MTENVDAVEQTGDSKQARELSVRLAVPEMDCPSCAQKVGKALQRVDGITDTTLQPTTGTATVTYNSDRVTEADVVAAIEGAGYDVVGDESDSREESTGGVEIAPPSEIWTSSRAIKTWIGAGFLVFGLLFEFVLTGQNIEAATVLDYPLTLADGLFFVAIAVSGYPVVRGGYYSAKNLSLDIDFLMGTAIIAATGIGYFVEAATLAVLFSIAELLEDYAMDRARNSLRELMELSPDEATVRRNGDEVTVAAEDVDVGETVIVRPGEKIPLDGSVVEGESAVDESSITGESVPIDKSSGDEVFAGSINAEGYLEVEVTSTAGDSTLSKIIEMVQGAQEKKTEKEQFVDRFSGYYTPIVVVLAILTAAVPPLAFGWPWQTWFIRGLTLLVIACPCAFVISTPVSVVSGITSAAKNGVLIKGGNHLEAMGEIDAIAMDKTGTLTKGELTVTDVIPFGDYSESDVLRYGAGLEQRSEHPIAEAILTHTEDSEGIDLPPVSNFESLTGKGIQATIDGETYYAGKPALFGELGFDLPQARSVTDGGVVPEEVTENSSPEEAEKEYADHVLAGLEEEGRTVVLIGTETELLGGIAIADEVRPISQRAVERLHELGIGHVVMLTGDNEGTAQAIAEQVGVDEYHAELLPDQKVEAIDELSDEYGDVAMVGDGVNDAPALATATVGIAMGAAGTDTALETADIALMGDDLSKLPYLYELSDKAGNVIQQNIWTSLGAKALLAIGVPLGYVSVAVAVVVGDMGMSLGVTGNAMRLSRMVPDTLRGGDSSK